MTEIKKMIVYVNVMITYVKNIKKILIYVNVMLI